MKTLIILTLSLFSLTAFCSNEAVCINDKDCEELSALPSEFNNPEVTVEQSENAYVLADEILIDIGRSIAGDFEEE